MQMIFKTLINVWLNILMTLKIIQSDCLDLGIVYTFYINLTLIYNFFGANASVFFVIVSMRYINKQPIWMSYHLWCSKEFVYICRLNNKINTSFPVILN